MIKRILFTIGVLALLGIPVAAQSRTQFYPSISAEGAYSDNLGYSPTATDSDTAYTLSLNLPVTRSWQTGSLNFLYTASAYKFDENDLFDRTDHNLNFGVNSDLSRRSNLSFNTSFSRSQNQTTTLFTSPTTLNDIILTQRVDRDLFTGQLGYGLQVSPKWSLNLGVRAGSTNNEDIIGITGGLPVEDRDFTSYSAGMGRQVSQKTTVGFSLGFQENRLQFSGDEEVSTADFTVGRVVSRQSSLNASVGYYSTNSMIAGAPDRTGGQLSLNYNRSLRRVGFSAFAGYRPTSGGNTPGTATDTNVGVAFSGPGTRTLFWDISLQAAQRDPADPTLPEVDSRGAGAGLTWVASPKFGLRVRAATFRQSVSGVPDTEVLNATLGVVWFPRGKGRGRS